MSRPHDPHRTRALRDRFSLEPMILNSPYIGWHNIFYHLLWPICGDAADGYIWCWTMMVTKKRASIVPMTLHFPLWRCQPLLYISCDKRMNVGHPDISATIRLVRPFWPVALLYEINKRSEIKCCIFYGYFILLASINRSRGLKSDDDSCSFTLATSFGCKMSNQLWPNNSLCE